MSRVYTRVVLMSPLPLLIVLNVSNVVALLVCT